MFLLLSALMLTSALPDATYEAAMTTYADSTKPKKIDWSLVPIVSKSPDTDWALGVLPQVVFRLPGTTRGSRTYVAAYYTLNKQYAFLAHGSIWFNADRDHVQARTETKYWPTHFYGLSASNTNGKGVPYTERTSSVSISGSRRFGSGLRLGIGGSVIRKTLTFENDHVEDELGSVRGSEGGWLVSLGPVIGLDSRDQVFYPTRGWYVQLSTTLSGIVGDYDRGTANLDVRTYHKIAARQVIAGQMLLNVNTAGVPFWAMRGVGSVVRGYSSLRFLDRQMAAAQIEYRFVPVTWRIGLTVFAGVGSVAGRIDELPTATLRWAAGVGFRFLFMKDAKINIRWDFGFAPGSSGDYLEMSEAF